MTLSTLKIQYLRNLSNVAVELAPTFNLFIGQNGSGKTSILEAIHFLSLGRSFRSRINSRIIQYQQQQFTIFSQLQDQTTIGLQKTIDGQQTIKINSEKQASIAACAKLIPVQLINPDSYQLLINAKSRRQFIDWGVFHVEHQFFELWTQCQKILKQRNMALRSQLPDNQITVWDHNLVTLAAEIDSMRADYIASLMPHIQTYIADFLGIDIKIKYSRGWSEDHGLQTILQQRLQQDKQLGYTRCGPQRADLRITVNNHPVEQVLSRGQQKLLVFAMKLAQGKLLKINNDIRCIYLIDDLAAELDSKKRCCLLSALPALDAQVFLTGLEDQLFNSVIEQYAAEKFHVKHGVLAEKVV